MFVHPKSPAQIEVKAFIKALLFDKASIVVPVEYFDYNKIFLAKNITEFSKHNKINYHAIQLEKSK